MDKEISVRHKTVEFWMNECAKTNMILEEIHNHPDKKFFPVHETIKISKKQIGQISRLRKEIQGLLQNDFLSGQQTSHFVNMIRLCDGWVRFLRMETRKLESEGGSELF